MQANAWHSQTAHIDSALRRLAELSPTTLVLCGLWTFIACVSIYDAYLVVKFREVILDVEQNPICRELIRMDRTTLLLFLLAKGAGTACVLAVLWGVYCLYSRLALPIALGVGAFQLGLLFWLHLAPA